MIKLQVQQLLIEKGVENPNHFLMKNGFSRITAYRILTNDLKSINFKIMEDLCLLLKCTPNDLLVWTNSSKFPDMSQHPLQQLKRELSNIPISKKIREIPLEKLKDLHVYIDKLSNPTEL